MVADGNLWTATEHKQEEKQAYTGDEQAPSEQLRTAKDTPSADIEQTQGQVAHLLTYRAKHGIFY